MTGNTAREIVDQAAAHAGRDHVARVAAVVLATSLLVLGVYFGPRIVSQGDRIGELETTARDSAVAATKLADQVKALGGTPVVQPPPVPVTASAAPDPAMLRQAARVAVADYCAAPSHPCRGVDGASPNFDAIVTTVLARMPTPEDGRDGKDSASPDWAAQVAAYCGQVTEPCRGPAGQKGADGKDGQDGKPGAEGPPGPTCPDGYTAQSRRQGTETWWVCVADAASTLPLGGS
ncbi:hypothetical protein ACFWIW_10620 [Amycolatopsis sp. NPDC058340]|uniref:hypothetical protein n=1 Tax=Amycolatopsis sp. NPDC058340 TaxID=3346453 RepID=UPI00364E3C74